MTTTDITTQTLHLEFDDTTHTENFRRIHRWNQTSWLAWGGETGALVHIPADRTTTHTPIQYWGDEDDIRAWATGASLVAVGLEAGGVLLYERNDDWTDPTATPPTPMVGPVQEAPVRDLVVVNQDVVLIASEAGWYAWNRRKNTIPPPLRLEETQVHHRHSGIRSLAWNSASRRVASLDMAGYWCVWEQQSNEGWTLLYASYTKNDRCITKPDVGEALGADPWDRASRIVWRDEALFLPGERWVQVRDAAGKIYDDEAVTEGHTGVIVSGAVRGEGLVTIGRDARVVLWTVQRKVWWNLELVDSCVVCSSL